MLPRAGSSRSARTRLPGMPLVHGPRYDRRRKPVELGFVPVVRTLEYDRDRRRNEVERLFRRLKGYRRVFTRYDKLDVLFLVVHALIFDALR